MGFTRYFAHIFLLLSFFLSSFASASTGSACNTTGEDVVPFTIELTWDLVNPTNGIPRYAILVNGSFPGPTLNLNVGQTVEFTVINNLPNATTVHFHGIGLKATPWADGVPGVSQKPILPGSTYVYTWTADESGVYFYHSHFQGQMSDGLYGAIVIAAADGADKPFSLISNSSSDIDALNKAEASVETIFVSDWTQYTFDEFFSIQEAANVDDSCVDSIILNGKGSVYCLSSDEISALEAPQLPSILAGAQLTAKACIPPNITAIQGNYTRDLTAVPPGAYDVCTPSAGSNYTYTVDPADGWAAITFIHPGLLSLLKVTIDSHKLYVYEVNGHYIVPQVVDQIDVNHGDRYSFFVKLDQAVGTYPIRVANNGINQIISGFGALEYKGSAGLSSTAVAAMNYGGTNTTDIVVFDTTQAAPYPAVPVAADADVTYVLDISRAPHLSFSYEWTLSGINPYNISNFAAPLLYQDPSTVTATDTILKNDYGQWVDLIIKTAGPIAQPHPIHKHANKFFLLGQGAGDFNYSTVADAAAAIPSAFNFVNPPYRDGSTTTPAEGTGAWMVLRYQAANPGAWLLHCHIETHMGGGMAIALLDGVDKFPTVPSGVGTACPATGASVTSNSTSAAGSGTSGTSGTSSSSSTSSAGTATYTGAANTVHTFGSSVLVGVFALAAALSL